MDLSARDLAEVLLVEALARDDLLAAAGHLLGMRLGRLNEVLPVLSFLGLQPDEFLVLMKLCQSHEQDPTARFLQLYEACAVHHDRAIHARQANEDPVIHAVPPALAPASGPGSG